MISLLSEIMYFIFKHNIYCKQIQIILMLITQCGLLNVKSTQSVLPGAYDVKYLWNCIVATSDIKSKFCLYYMLLILHNTSQN